MKLFLKLNVKDDVEKVEEVKKELVFLKKEF